MTFSSTGTITTFHKYIGKWNVETFFSPHWFHRDANEVIHDLKENNHDFYLFFYLHQTPE